MNHFRTNFLIPTYPWFLTTMSEGMNGHPLEALIKFRRNNHVTKNNRKKNDMAPKAVQLVTLIALFSLSLMLVRLL